MAILTVNDVTKTFGEMKALDNVSFEVAAGEIVALLGPSGSGKSTLLNIIAGLENPDHGVLLWDGEEINNMPPHLRQFGLMFQDFALFPHMSVYANVAFGLKMSHLETEKIGRRVEEMLSLVGLSGFSKRDINTLSGGEQQRVALARALAPHPRLLMLDEPLGSLDRNLRERLVIDLQTILKQMHQTAIYVTHDQEEAFTIADRIILLNSGKVEQIGTPQEIYTNPASIFVARFLEMTNIFSGVVHSQNNKHFVRTPIGDFPIDASAGGKVSLLIRPEMVQLGNLGAVKFQGILKGISFRGSMQRITLLINNNTLNFEVPSMVHVPPIGSDVTISINPDIAIKVFSKQ